MASGRANIQQGIENVPPICPGSGSYSITLSGCCIRQATRHRGSLVECSRRRQSHEWRRKSIYIISIVVEENSCIVEGRSWCRGGTASRCPAWRRFSAKPRAVWMRESDSCLDESSDPLATRAPRHQLRSSHNLGGTDNLNGAGGSETELTGELGRVDQFDPNSVTFAPLPPVPGRPANPLIPSRPNQARCP